MLQSERRVGRLISDQRVIFTFFFISGIPALIYQLLWQRALFRLFGVDMASITIVVTAFMLGLGFGALFGSWLSLRSSRYQLLILCVIEAAVGLFGLWSLDIINSLSQAAQTMSLPLQALVATALLVLPTGLMGATLPLLVTHLVHRSINVGGTTGYLYYINTLGAFAGCLLAALVLFPWLGMTGTIRVAAALNGIAACCALTAFAVEPRHPIPQWRTEKTATSLRRPVSYAGCLCIALLGGYISLSYEMFCIHLISFATGSNALAFAIVLAIYLLGIASGARSAAVLCENDDGTAAINREIFLTLLLTGLASVAVLPLILFLKSIPGIALALITVFAFTVARGFGMLFPTITYFCIPADRRSGSRVGRLYAANIVGSALGSAITGFLLSDLLGMDGMAVFLALATLATVAILARTIGGLFVSTRRSMMIGACLLTGAVLLVLQPNATYLAGVMLGTAVNKLPPVVRVVENRNGIIAVNATGQVFGGGAYDGAFNIDPVHDVNGIVRPYGLSLYHPAPREVLMIGLSSGSWAQVIANNPAVDHLTIIEINPGYLNLIRDTPTVSSLLSNAKVKIIIDDGRRWLRRHPQEKFDAIMANSVIHFRSNATNLLSSEFDQIIRAHLKAGGIYFFNTTDSLRVQRTGCESFRYGYRVLNHLLVSDQPIALDIDRWRSALTAYKIDGKMVFDLTQSTDRAALQEILKIPDALTPDNSHAKDGLMESCTSLLARTSGVQSITDDNMGTEWRYPLRLN